MSRRRDRAFHLTVAVFALTLAGISAVTLYSEATGHALPFRWMPFHLSGPANPNRTNQAPKATKSATAALPGPPRGSGASSGNNLRATGQGALAKDLAGKPVFREANNSAHVTVVATNADVPQAAVAKTQQLLASYQIVHVVSTTLQMNLSSTVRIYLAENQQDYQKDLNSLFGISISQAKSYSADTGGFTQNESILIPLYQNTSLPDLANTLAHELTHAFINDNAAAVPSWINEGLAVHDGMRVQSEVENSVQFAGEARALAETVVQAAGNGTLVPLTANEQAVLGGHAPYDLELQDWLAVTWLDEQHGTSLWSDYFYRLNAQESSNKAFSRTFGETPAAFDQSFTALLKRSATVADPGVQLTFRVSPGFAGMLRLLQHSSHTWDSFHARTGTVTVSVLPNGKLTGPVGPIKGVYDSTTPDPHTLYVNLDPNGVVKQGGQTVNNSGFAIDYHDGMYGYVNSWITWADGKTTYIYTPSLFGVSLTRVLEGKNSNPVLAIINGATGTATGGAGG